MVLRTWPVREADLIVSFFTRDYGRVKGIAKSALKSRKRFGGALEPMTLARAWFAERPRQELVRLDQLEILRSPLSAPVDHARMAVLSFYAEVIDEALPEHDPQETVFRLLVSVLEQTTVAESDLVQPRMPLFTVGVAQIEARLRTAMLLPADGIANILMDCLFLGCKKTIECIQRSRGPFANFIVFKDTRISVLCSVQPYHRQALS